MRSILRTIILSICLVVPTMLCLSACDSEQTAKVSSFSVQFTNASYTLVDDTITVTYGEDYRLSANDFSVTAIFDDETSRTLTANELVDYGFTYVSNIPDIAKTPVGSYTVSINHAELETSKNITLVVEKATINYSESDIKWSANEVAYDGTEKTVTITNLPDALEVVYQNNTKTNADKYVATATISVIDSDNYNFEEITVVHIWQIKLIDYEITYENTYELENNNPATYTLMTDAITLKSLIGRDYYTFEGWYYDGEKITTIPQGFTGGNITLEAKWTPITYTVTYQETKDMVNPNPTTYTIEDGTITLAPLPNRVDYTFRYWERVYDNIYQVDPFSTTTISVSKHKGNVTLKAVWDKKTEYDAFEYTVSKDGTQATITGLTNASSTQITIPSGVVAIGNEAFKDCTTLSSVQFEEGSQLLTIGDYAFYHCGIRSITIPASVTGIGNYSFARSGISEMNFSSDSNLTSIGNNTFDNCDYLTEFTIPDSVVSMGKNVFNVCIYLTKVVFGQGMTVIGENIYGSTAVLKEVEFRGAVTSFHKNAFNNVATKNVTLTLNWYQKHLEQQVYAIIGGGSGYSDEYFAQSTYFREKKGVNVTTEFCEKTFASVCFVYDATNVTVDEFTSDLDAMKAGNFVNLKFVLPESADAYFPVIKTTLNSKYSDINVGLIIDGATKVSNRAFANCTVLSSINISDSVTKIEEYAFQSCSALGSVTIPSSVTSIGSSAFFHCYALESVVIPNTVTKIEADTFQFCQSLASISIPNSVTTIGKRAFGYCNALSSITIHKYVTNIENLAFTNCASLSSVIFEEDSKLTSIGEYAFSCCGSLKNIKMPDSVSTIGIYAFAYCDALTSITIPKNVNRIEDGTFDNCSSLTTIIFAKGSELNSIGAFSAFRHCYALTTIVFPSGVTVIWENTFSDCSLLTTVYYTGTEEKWNELLYSGGNENLMNATRYYYSETKQSSGNYWRYVNGVPTIWK